MNRSLLFVLATPVSLILSACASNNPGAASASMEEHAVNHQATAADLAALKSKEPIPGAGAVLWVNGLGCPLCASNIDKQLERVRGVSTVRVDLSSGMVTLALKPGAPHPSPARLTDAVADAGFTLVKVEQR